MAEEVVVIGDGTVSTMVAENASDAQDKASEIETMDGPPSQPQEDVTIQESTESDDEVIPSDAETSGDETETDAAADTEVEEEPEPGIGDEDHPPEFPQALLDQAKTLGMSDAMIQTYPDPLLLSDAVSVLASARAQAGREAKQAASAAREQPPQPQRAPRPQEPLGDEQVEQALAAFDAVNPEQYEEPMVKAMQSAKTLLTAQHAQLQQTREYIGRLVEIVQQFQGRDDARELDHFVRTLGDAGKDIYDEGTYLDVDTASTGFANRQKLNAMVDDIATGMLDRGEKLPPVRMLFQLAHGALFADQTASSERKKIAAKLRRRKKALSPRVETERGEMPLGEARALQALSEQMGVAPGTDDMREFEESLGLDS